MSYTYLKVFEKQVPLNNKYEDVVAFWKVYNGKKFLNNLDKHSFFSSYDSNYNNLNHYILLNFPRRINYFRHFNKRTSRK